MKQRSSGFIFGIVASIILGFGIIALVALGLRANGGLGYEPDVMQATKTPGSNTASLALGTYPDSMLCHPDADSQKIQWVTYCPTTSLEVPANSIVTITIMQYDTASGVINDYFRQVHGTIGGDMVVNGKSMT